MCHPEPVLIKKPMHGKAVTQPKAPACSECHEPHSIKRIAEWKAGISDQQYCLTCHKHRLSMTLKSGELLPLFVDGKLITKSVHGKLPCGNCHAGFSKDAHPLKVYKNKHEYSSFMGGACKKCHAEADKLYEGSIHAILLKEGNLKAPSCTGCHGFHYVIKATTDKNFGLASCTRCHSDMNRGYEKSIHAAARIIKGKENAPLCSSCHKAHDVQVMGTTAQTKGVCIKCHQNIEDAHKKWLSNPPFKLSSFASLHLNTVVCAVCHSPGASARVYLDLYDRKKKKPLAEEDVLKLLKVDFQGLKKKLDPEGKGVGSTELWNITKQLQEKGADVSFLGRLDVRNDIRAHEIAEKARAIKDCEKCHRADSEFFKDVSVVLLKSDGRPTFFSA